MGCLTSLADSGPPQFLDRAGDVLTAHATLTAKMPNGTDPLRFQGGRDVSDPIVSLARQTDFQTMSFFAGMTVVGVTDGEVVANVPESSLTLDGSMTTRSLEETIRLVSPYLTLPKRSCRAATVRPGTICTSSRPWVWARAMAGTWHPSMRGPKLRTEPHRGAGAQPRYSSTSFSAKPTYVPGVRLDNRAETSSGRPRPPTNERMAASSIAWPRVRSLRRS